MPNPHRLKLPRGFIKSIESIKRIDDTGMLYSMENHSNYYLLEKYVNMLATPGCSTFLTTNEKGEYLFGRNYDFVHFKNNDREKGEITALNVVVYNSNWGARYKSVGIADAFWLDFAKGRMIEGCLDDGKTDISALALLPFLCMDGMNEKGLAVSVMHLPTENEWTETEYKPYESLSEEDKKKCVHLEKAGEEPKRLDINIRSGWIAINDMDKKAWKVNKNLSTHQTAKHKKTMFQPVIMRRMLDYCKNVDEAIKLAKKTNIRSPLPDNDYHVMVADKSGKSVILEWVNNELKVVPAMHGTNYYLSREDHYGYGHDRDEIMEKTLNDKDHPMNDESAGKLLETISQDYRIPKFNSISIWSSLYNLTEGKIKMWQMMDYSKVYEFEMKVK